MVRLSWRLCFILAILSAKKVGVDFDVINKSESCFESKTSYFQAKQRLPLYELGVN